MELVRLRCSLLNGCEYCIALHSAELRKHHEPETRIAAVADWQNSDAFTPRDGAALAWADAITNIQQEHASEAQFQAVQEFFQGKDLSDLTLAIASINAWNRMAIAFRPQWRGGNRAENAKAPVPSASLTTHHERTAKNVLPDVAGGSAVNEVGDKVAQD